MAFVSATTKEFSLRADRLLDKTRTLCGQELLLDTLVAYADDSKERLEMVLHTVARYSPGVVYCNEPPTVLALRKLSPRLPLLFSAHFDPVEIDLVRSMSSPGYATTGLVTSWPTGPKLVSLAAISLSPPAKTIGLLTDIASAPTADTRFAPMKHAAILAGSTLKWVPCRDRELPINEAELAGVEIAVVPADDVTWYRAKALVQQLSGLGIPCVVDHPGLFSQGATVMYCADTSRVYDELAGYAFRILKGERPEALPVLHPDRFRLTVSQAAFRRLGITPSLSVLQRANQIVA